MASDLDRLDCLVPVGLHLDVTLHLPSRQSGHNLFRCLDVMRQVKIGKPSATLMDLDVQPRSKMPKIIINEFQHSASRPDTSITKLHLVTNMTASPYLYLNYTLHLVEKPWVVLLTVGVSDAK